MKDTELIRIFYKSGKGNLIAFRGYDLKARYYRYTRKRIALILPLLRGWKMTGTDIATTFYRPN